MFTTWFEKFIKFSRTSKDNLVLPPLDGHANHTKDMAILDLGLKLGRTFFYFHHITLIGSNPYTSFMKPLLDYYTEGTNYWLRANSGSVIIQVLLAGLVGKAFQKLALLTIASNFFQV